MVVPSRGRPGSIARLRDAMAATCRGDTDLLVGVDDDDPSLAEYLALQGVGLVVQSGLRQVVAWINWMAVPRAKGYRYIGTIGDDNVPRTVGWDVRVIETLAEMKTGLCFGDDLYPTRATGSLCCHVFMTSNIIRKLGYMGPPDGPRHMYVDPLWLAWGEKVGIKFLPDVIIEHLHYTTGQSPHDQVYAESYALTWQDCEAFNRYARSGSLNRDILKINPKASPFTDAELADFKVRLNIPG